MKKKNSALPLVTLTVLGMLVFYVFHSCTKDSEIPMPPAEEGPTVDPQSSKSTPKESLHSKKALVAEGGQMVSIENYQKYLEKVLTTLPRVEDLKKLSSEELHHTPPSVLNAAHDFVRIIEGAKQSQEHAHQSKKFFHDCALKEEVATSLRASCLSNLMDLHVAAGQKKEDFDLSPYPEKITRLVEGF